MFAVIRSAAVQRLPHRILQVTQTKTKPLTTILSKRHQNLHRKSASNCLRMASFQCALFIPNHIKTKNKRKNVSAAIDEFPMYPLAVNYDADIHDALASLRILDGTIPRHAKHGAPVIVCFAPARIVKFFVKPNTPVLG
jgi:hypothetical protein